MTGSYHMEGAGSSDPISCKVRRSRRVYTYENTADGNRLGSRTSRAHAAGAGTSRPALGLPHGPGQGSPQGGGSLPEHLPSPLREMGSVPPGHEFHGVGEADRPI